MMHWRPPRSGRLEELILRRGPELRDSWGRGMRAALAGLLVLLSTTGTAGVAYAQGGSPPTDLMGWVWYGGALGVLIALGGMFFRALKGGDLRTKQEVEALERFCTFQTAVNQGLTGQLTPALEKLVQAVATENNLLVAKAAVLQQLLDGNRETVKALNTIAHGQEDIRNALNTITYALRRMGTDPGPDPFPGRGDRTPGV